MGREKKVSGIVFDFNGTLFWDTQLHIDAWMRYCAERNIPLTLDDFYKKVHGKSNEAIFKVLLNRTLSTEEGKIEEENKESLYRKICVERGLGLAPGAEELLNRLKEIGMPFTIATASYYENVKFFYEFTHLDRWFQFEDIVYLDGAVPAKPDPTMYFKAMKIINQEPANVLIFEDSPPGIQAAIASGAGNLILVNSDGRDYSRYPYEVIRNFHEVLSRF